MVNISYIIAPFFAYIVAGSIKFLINSIKNKRLAFKEIGLGGFPSTHNTITSTIASLIAFNEGIHSPALAVALGLVVIVGLDSIGLRKHIEEHASIIAKYFPEIAIRKKLAHSRIEALFGILLGIVCGWILHIAKGIS
ncbi:MAG: divergent PAP2 family protein [Gammaproteobacteria bacterium]|nr:divergent PAP2 family protein [Gammaproteobacteria bacterium]